MPGCVMGGKDQGARREQGPLFQPWRRRRKRRGEKRCCSNIGWMDLRGSNEWGHHLGGTHPPKASPVGPRQVLVPLPSREISRAFT